MATAQKGGSGHGGGSMPSGNGGGGQYIGALSGHKIGGGHAVDWANAVEIMASKTTYIFIYKKIKHGIIF